MSTSTVLDEIIVGVREDLTQRMEQVPLERVKACPGRACGVTR